MAKRFTTIENDTPILPDVLAEATIREIGVYLYHEKGFDLFSRIDERAVATELAERAERVYARQKSQRWGRQIRGVNGRDHLQVFFRHWLTASLSREAPESLKLLPYRFEVGAPAPRPTTLRALPKAA